MATSSSSKEPSQRDAHSDSKRFPIPNIHVFAGCFFIALVLTGLLIFLSWINHRPHRPRFYIASFSAPAFLSQRNAVISFNVTNRNRSKNTGIFYNNSAASLFYGEEMIGEIGSKPPLFPVYQPPKNATSLNGVFNGDSLEVGEKTWKQFRKDAKDRDTVAFRLELRSEFRFTDSRRSYALQASCHVDLQPNGQLMPSFKGKQCSAYFFPWKF